jgi:drug/metabolite transporter (DMT)-like permease
MTIRLPLLYVALTGVLLLWRTSFAAAQIGVRELVPLHLVTFRFILASLIIAIVAGLLFMGEQLSVWVAVGGLLVLGGVYCINSASVKQQETRSQHAACNFD